MSLNSLLSVLLVIAGVYCALLLYLVVMQPRLIYYPDMPSRNLVATPAAIGLDYESLALTTTDGIKLHGWFIPAKAARGSLLFCHGNAGNISHRLDSIALFHELGLDVLIFDYRGYGESEGKPSEAGTYRDVDAAWRYLQEVRGRTPSEIVIFGRSLGASIAAELASRSTPAAVILESAFTSVPDMAVAIYPWLPRKLPGMYRYDSRASVAQITRPLLIAHSREDEIIPFAHGERLFADAGEPKHFLEMQGGHNDGFLVSRKAYVATMREFIGRYLP
jgi:fermentation-respiration switch protein FrsA (DUF1100 family)